MDHQVLGMELPDRLALSPEGTDYTQDCVSPLRDPLYGIPGGSYSHSGHCSS